MKKYLVYEREVPESEILEWANGWGRKYLSDYNYRLEKPVVEVTEEVLNKFTEFNDLTFRNPFLLVQVDSSFRDDFGNSASFTTEHCIEVKNLEEGRLIAEILLRRKYGVTIKPLRLMFPNVVEQDYSEIPVDNAG